MNCADINDPLVSIVIVTHNRKEKLSRLIRSILESNYPKNKLEIIIIDDASKDGTYDYIRQTFQFPQIRIIRNKEEKLVSKSRNIGIKVSRGKYIFIIDDDNVIDKDAIKELVGFMEKYTKVGVAAPLMFYLSEPGTIWCAGIKRNYWTTLTKYVYNLNRGSKKDIYGLESDDFPNAFIIRRDIIKKVGMFNHILFPIHYEEADLCSRVRLAGFKVMLCPRAKVWHDVPKCTILRPSITRTTKRMYYTIRNRFIYHKMYSRNSLQYIVSTLMSLIISLCFISAIVFNTSLSNNQRIELILWAIRGLVDGLKMKIPRMSRSKYE